MPLRPVPRLIELAGPGGLGAFNVITLEHAEAIAAAAEATERPAILQISENTVKYHGGLKPLGRACLAIAEDSTADLAVHLDHATDTALIREAVELGLGSVMYDGAALEYGENVAATAEITRWCHAREVFVEAELGEVGGKDGAHAPGVRTDPDEAAAFAAATDVDALAVAVGSVHAMQTRAAQLDEELITRLAAALDIPLVLHGSSGVPDEGLRAAVRHGMVKINYGTRLNIALTEAVRIALAAAPGASDPRKYLGPGRFGIQRDVEHHLRVIAARTLRAVPN
ncbi:class II fructose-bisphosphate aldolase [Nocardia sp. NBC_01327]|uniref:class II fructose-bisphosphate aldolase n=1 Tax=Nocardia sp. NBC_01327 TaxID=2903593 RepID=UPI002E13914D|nr:class II fructose-bisphosphate aldolase [Nocardia sp. NBC_01327]